MRLALWLAAASLPLAAQPRLLINAKVDTRPASGGLEREFKTLLAAQPQPAWIAYSVPAQGRGLGCELVSPGGWWAPGTVHLEPPDHMVLMFRVEANAVERVRALSPDCEIDAGGLPVHWLADVAPGESAALLARLAEGNARLRPQAYSALARTAEGISMLIGTVKSSRDAETRKQAMSALSRSRDPRAAALFEEMLK